MKSTEIANILTDASMPKGLTFLQEYEMLHAANAVSDIIQEDQVDQID